MSEIKFLLAVWTANLQSAMEYRASFITQTLGMMLNNFIYFLIWVIFFDQFKDVRGWGLDDMYVTFAITASAFGLVSLFFGNVFNLGDIILRGRLDYYLSLPRSVLLHTISSHSVASGMGDLAYGFLSFILLGAFTWAGLARFTVAILFSAAIFAAFLIIIGSLAFWIGSSTYLTNLALNAMVTFAIYPITLFDSTAKLILFTLIPAALMGAVPAGLVNSFSWQDLLTLLAGSLVFLGIAIMIFYAGLKRYESGSGIQVEV